MKNFLFCFLLWTSFLCADEDFSDPQIGKNQKVLDKRENYFLTATDYKIEPKVNPITGEYCEEEEDLVVAGCEPLSMRRFYNHFSISDNRYAGWRYNPEAFLAANFEWAGQEIFAAVGNNDGSVCALKRSAYDYGTFDFSPPQSFIAFKPDGKNHPLNVKITYVHQGDGWQVLKRNGALDPIAGLPTMFLFMRNDCLMETLSVMPIRAGKKRRRNTQNLNSSAPLLPIIATKPRYLAPSNFLIQG